MIIDEAHNLLDTIGNIHSCEVTGHQLSHAYSQIVQYRDKYQSKFAAKNLLRINQIIYVLSRFIKYIGKGTDSTFLKYDGGGSSSSGRRASKPY